jgi:hypothetical protein
LEHIQAARTPVRGQTKRPRKEKWHFQAKHALGLDPRVDTGSPSENAIKQREMERSRISSNGIRSRTIRLRPAAFHKDRP